MKKLYILMLFLIITPLLKSQTTLTKGHIYDFNINDEFHYKDSYTPINATRFTIVGKHFSALNDTVFYIRQFNNYYTQFSSNPVSHLDYFFNSYNDTVFYTDLNTPFDSAYINWPVYDTVGNTFSFLSSYSSRWCGKLTYKYTACIHCIFEGNYYSYQYGEGLGLVESSHQYAGYPQIDDEYYLVYYKKDTVSCGFPDTTTLSIKNYEKITPNINIYPNPATSKLTINLQQLTHLQNTTVSIYDVQGKLLLQQSITQPQTEFNIAAFAKGIYVVKVNNDNNCMQSKFVKE
ncbi:MAG: T9SS type A sorting domain-containing protein [Bacteroidales bacterium]